MASERSFQELRHEVPAALVRMTRTASQILNEDLTFQRSINPEVDRLIEEQSRRLLSLVRDLNKTAAVSTDTPPPPLKNVDSVEDGWRGIVDVIDNLLEKADACLDEFTGVVKKLTPENLREAAAADAKKPLAKHEYRYQNLPKPQRLFKKVPTNDESTPFKPLLQLKPNAIVSLKDSLVTVPTQDGATQYRHPYESEIKQSAYPDSTYLQSDPKPFSPFDSTDAVWVDSPEAVREMLQDLKKAKEIAIDLEHHEIHTYVGLVSLMQISTREKDWIVDTLVPWREDLQVLNEAFTDPRIIKVLHGSTSDIVWLQRDLGLYIVGLFDTYHASNLLGYPKHGLAYLLQRFANYDTDKRYQMADWRMRPLPKQMYDYARSDTHFLLYIFDNIRNELLSKSDMADPDGNLVDKVRDLSKNEALQCYERTFYDAKSGSGIWGWQGMLSRSPGRFDRQQFAVFRAVHEWRDKRARQHDESIHQILSNRAMFVIAREMPTEMPLLLSYCQPLHKETRKSAPELLQIIKVAKAEGLNGPELEDVVHLRAPAYANAVYSAQAASSLSIKAVPAAVQSLTETRSSSGTTLAKLDMSRFWGSTISQDDKEVQPVHRRYGENPHLALPLPPLTAEVFETKDSGESSTPATASSFDPRARAEHQYTNKRKSQDEDVFVLKQMRSSKRRKANGVEGGPEPVAKEGMALSSDNAIVGGNDEDMEMSLAGMENEQEVNDAARRHEERKMRRRFKKEQKKQEELRRINANGEGELEAFDYEHAPSVLHARRENNGVAGAKKGIVPYSKSLNAPNGVRKEQREGLGRSMTYRS
ncbi:MAG: hypothetical protein Q9170_004256 [Blastenia crenularia]